MIDLNTKNLAPDCSGSLLASYIISIALISSFRNNFYGKRKGSQQKDEQEAVYNVNQKSASMELGISKKEWNGSRIISRSENNMNNDGDDEKNIPNDVHQ